MLEVIGISCCDRNGAVGHKGRLPWSIPEDIEHFRNQINDQVVLVGRTTFKTMPKSLPYRHAIVITSSPEKYQDTEHITYLDNPEEAIGVFNNFGLESHKLYVLGGPQIWLDVWFHITTWDLSIIDNVYQGDAYHPFVNIRSLYSWGHGGPSSIYSKLDMIIAGIFNREMGGKWELVDREYRFTSHGQLSQLTLKKVGSE